MKTSNRFVGAFQEGKHFLSQVFEFQKHVFNSSSQPNQSNSLCTLLRARNHTRFSIEIRTFSCSISFRAVVVSICMFLHSTKIAAHFLSLALGIVREETLSYSAQNAFRQQQTTVVKKPEIHDFSKY